MAIARLFSIFISAIMLAAILSAPVVAQSVAPLSETARPETKIETFIVDGRPAEAIEINTAQGQLSVHGRNCRYAG